MSDSKKKKKVGANSRSCSAPTLALHLDVFRDAQFRVDAVVGRKSSLYGSVKTGALCQRLTRRVEEHEQIVQHHHQQHGESGPPPEQWWSNADVDLNYYHPGYENEGASALHRRLLEEIGNKLRGKANYHNINLVAPRNGNGVVVLHCVEVIQGLRNGATGVVVAAARDVVWDKKKKQRAVEVLLPIKLTVNNHVAEGSSKLLQQYMTCPLAKDLTLRVKRWAKSQRLIFRDPREGFLPSFAYTLMAVSFLQSLNLLPLLQNSGDASCRGWSSPGEQLWDWGALSDEDFYVGSLDMLVASWGRGSYAGSNMRTLILELLQHEHLTGGGPPANNIASMTQGQTRAMLFLSRLEIEFFRFLQARIQQTSTQVHHPNVLSITNGVAPDFSGLGGHALAVEDPVSPYRILRCSGHFQFNTLCDAIMKQEAEQQRAFAEMSHEFVDLEPSETSWVHQNRKRKQAIAKDQGEDAKDAEVHRKLKGLLNKLATKNFDSICGQIIALLKKQRHVEVLMREVFERASSPFTDPYTKDRAYLFVDLYTRLTKKVSDFLEGRRAEPFRVEAEPVTGLQQPSFQVMLLLLVHDAFEYSLEGARSFEMPFPDHLSGRYAAATAHKRRITGNVRLIATLLRENLVEPKLFTHLVRDLTEDTSNELNLEMLCILCETIGTAWISSFLEVEECARAEFQAQVQKLSKVENVKPRARFMIQDLVERLGNAKQARDFD